MTGQVATSAKQATLGAPLCPCRHYEDKQAHQGIFQPVLLVPAMLHYAFAGLGAVVARLAEAAAVRRAKPRLAAVPPRGAGGRLRRVGQAKGAAIAWPRLRRATRAHAASQAAQADVEI